MRPLLSCPAASASRIFPSPAAAPSAEPGPDQLERRAAWRLMQLPSRLLTRWQARSGWGLDSEGRMGRLLMQYREAVAAEGKGLFARADFFWRQMHRGLRRLYAAPGSWQALATSAIDAALLRKSFVREVVIDTHCAFFNGRMKAGSELGASDRAFAHVDYILSVLDLAELSAEQKLALLVPPGEMRIEAYLKAGRREMAIRSCRTLLAQFPAHVPLQDRLADLLADLGDLKGARDAGSLDARSVAWRITDLERLRGDYPHCLRAYETLESLYLLRAMALGKGGEISEALLQVERALAFDPQSATALETRTVLRASMHELQERMREVEATLKANPKATLNLKGLALKREAHRGSRPAEDFARSDEPRRIEQGYAQARVEAQRRSAAQPAGAAAAAASVLASPAAGTPGHEPLAEWLFSREAVRVKAQTAAALLLLALAAAIGIYDAGHRLRRDEAYQKAHAAIASGAYRRAADQAQTFLTTPSFAAADPRQSEMLGLQSEALVRWFVAHPEDFAGPSALRLSAYSALTTAKEIVP
jgi:tetratricopeptide (TPR) repeat protein